MVIGALSLTHTPSFFIITSNTFKYLHFETQMHMFTSSRFDNTVVQYIKYRHWSDMSRAKQGMTECERQKRFIDIQRKKQRKT